MRDTEIPGQVLKWPPLRDQKNVDGVGLKSQALHNPTRSCFLVVSWMTPSTEFVVGLLVGSPVCTRGVFNSPLNGFQGPLMMNLPFLNMFIL